MMLSICPSFLPLWCKNQALAAYTNGEIALQVNTWDSHAVTVSAVCLSAQQAPISFEFTGEIPLTITPYTSKPYPVMFDDGLAPGLTQLILERIFPAFRDGMDVGLSSISTGELVQTTVYSSYTNWAPEAIEISLSTLSSGTLEAAVGYKEYTNWAPEGLNTGLSSIKSGTLPVAVGYISYSSWAAEGLDPSLTSIESGTLS